MLYDVDKRLIDDFLNDESLGSLGESSYCLHSFVELSISGDAIRVKQIPYPGFRDAEEALPYRSGFCDAILIEAVKRYGKAVKQLSTGHNPVGPMGCYAVSKIENLKELDLYQSCVRSEYLESFAGSLSIEKLNIGHCRVDDACVPTLCSLKHLSYLDLGAGPGLSLAALREVIQMPSLRFVILSQHVSAPELTKEAIKNLHNLRPDVEFYPTYDDA